MGRFQLELIYRYFQIHEMLGGKTLESKGKLILTNLKVEVLKI